MCSFFFFFNDTATTEIYTLSLHDALPISLPEKRGSAASRVVRLSTVPTRSVHGERSTDRKSTRLNSSHTVISYAVFCLKKKKGKGRSQERGKPRKPDPYSPPQTYPLDDSA